VNPLNFADFKEFGKGKSSAEGLCCGPRLMFL
jgi:hypothetical protein